MVEENIPNSYYIYDENEHGTSNDLPCNLFDTTNNNIDLVQQKNLCENILTSTNETKCKFLEQGKYLPNSLNSKYQKITRCIPKNTEVTEAKFIDNGNDCTEAGFNWSDVNNRCIDIEQYHRSSKEQQRIISNNSITISNKQKH